MNETRRASDVAFTPAVKAAQARRGSRDMIARWGTRKDFGNTVTPDLAQFVAERDSLYLGTATADGQPYIQHRGGPKGFIKVIDDKTLAFADFRGNKQYVSLGNLDENDRAFLFLMDYPTRRRIKVWGRAQIVEGDEDLLAEVSDADYVGVPERVFRFTVEAWDANCPQHIAQRYTAEEMEPTIGALHDRIAQLETENRELKRLALA